MTKKYAPIVVRSVILGDGIPKICVPFTPSCEAEWTAQLEQIRQSPHDLIEWRVDYWNPQGSFSTDEEIQDFPLQETDRLLSCLRRQIGETPLLFTFRTRPEGGERAICAQAYRSLALTAASSGMADLIDLEYHWGEDFLRSLIPDLQAQGAGVVGSCHDFQKTPSKDEITDTLCQIQALGADLTKMAVMPHSRMDVLKLTEASVRMEEELADRPFITMSMGALGAITRLAGTFTGSAVTFASAGAASAPGQMDAGKVQEALRLLL